MSADLLARIERLEALDDIRQLVAKYALALDMRDMDAMAGLFVPDVQVGRGRSGREALRDYFDETMRVQFIGTSHHVGNHIIEFEGADTAKGIVYSKNEHETPSAWVAMQMMYADDYARIDGVWLFRRRLPLYWYAADMREPPIGEDKMRWPGRARYEGAFHALFPSWEAFWAREGALTGPVPEPAPRDQFIARMRAGAQDPRVRVR
jgi:uncharacterized protein (TIGR02246 family)